MTLGLLSTIYLESSVYLEYFTTHKPVEGVDCR